MDGKESPSGMSVTKIKGLEAINEVSHHTERYETPGLFLRRGQSFQIEIDLEKAFKENEDEFTIRFETGKYPTKITNTLAVATKVNGFKKEEWGYKLLTCVGTTIKVEIHVPANCIVASYSMVIESLYKDGEEQKSVVFKYEKPVYILFNAWCPEDEVYMSEERSRMEYVLNDDGALFWGGRRPKPWYFGQFTDATFRCVIKLLDTVMISLRDTAREIARAISALANDCDDNGVLTGNWSGDYDTGVKPWQWTGSVEIFKKYLETGKPVCYGQCWVFSGITTSLMRSLGIPTRSVTNYDSAHDTDNNLTFDKYFSEDGDYLEDESDDSCWNYHVWNESYMTRPDLPLGYGGWQAFDATPQEESRGKYRAGPASVRAIKEGKVDLNYDTKFIYAEVNADQVSWRYNKEKKEYEPFSVETDVVGTAVYTKKFGLYSRYRSYHDITGNYKHPEGSMLERVAARRAMKIAKSDALVKAPQDVSFTVKAAENVIRGKDVEVFLTMQNKSDKPLSANIVVTSQIVRYTGVELKKLLKRREKKDLQPKKEQTVSITFNPEEYADFAEENPMLRFTVMVMVSSGQSFAKQAVVAINEPDLIVSLVPPHSPNKVKPGETVDVKVEFDLPSDVKQLTQCSLLFDGSALEAPVKFQLPDTKAAKFVAEKPVTIKKIMKGRINVELIAMLSAKEMSAVEGIISLDLEK